MELQEFIARYEVAASLISKTTAIEDLSSIFGKKCSYPRQTADLV